MDLVIVEYKTEDFISAFKTFLIYPSGMNLQ